MIESLIDSIYAFFRENMHWKIGFFIFVMMMIRAGFKIQASNANNVDFLDFVRDPDTKRLAADKAFYCAGAASSVIVYCIACTRANTSLSEITAFTWAFGSLWTGSYALNKYVSRPVPAAAPATPTPPAPPAVANVTVNAAPTEEGKQS